MCNASCPTLLSNFHLTPSHFFFFFKANVKELDESWTIKLDMKHYSFFMVKVEGEGERERRMEIK
jgi:hypothetical protein